MINEQRIVDNFLDMVKIPSPSLKERVMADYVKAELEKIGLEVSEDNAGETCNGNAGNIIGVLKAKGSNKKKILFSAHMDTVLPCDKITPIMEDGIIKSDGTSVLGGDDKAGIAAILEMLKQIKENNLDHPEIIVVFSIAEEVGLFGARAMDVEKYAPDFGIIIDSGGKPGVVTVQAPFAAKGKIEIIGKPAHAGLEPENGINALVVASHAITKLRLGRVDENTTSNIGVVTGGTAVNIVMPSVSMMYEARSFDGKVLEELLAETKAIFTETAKEFGAEFKEAIVKGYDGFKIETGSEILRVLEGACKDINIEYKPMKSGGGSDTNIYNSKGIPSVNLGIGMSKVHTKEEFIKIRDMVGCTKLLLSIVDKI
jgi:tripeptide aminopeptidase